MVQTAALPKTTANWRLRFDEVLVDSSTFDGVSSRSRGHTEPFLPPFLRDASAGDRRPVHSAGAGNPVDRARRFARPLRWSKSTRRSSWRFVASMAELQERVAAFDLASKISIHARAECSPGTRELTTTVPERRCKASCLTFDSGRISAETLMRQCEETIKWRPDYWRQSIDLVKRLR